MKIQKKELITGIIFVMLGILILFFVKDIKVRDNLTEPGGRFFPKIIGIGMIVCGIGTALYREKKTGEERNPPLTKKEKLKLLSFFAVLFLYYFAMKYLGYLIATPLICFALIMMLRSDKKVSVWVAALLSLGITALIYFSFQYAFYIYLPKGVLTML